MIFIDVDFLFSKTLVFDRFWFGENKKSYDPWFKPNQECYDTKCDCATMKTFYKKTNQMYLLPAAIADCMNLENSYDNVQDLYGCSFDLMDDIFDQAGFGKGTIKGSVREILKCITRMKINLLLS